MYYVYKVFENGFHLYDVCKTKDEAEDSKNEGENKHIKNEKNFEWKVMKEAKL